MKYLYSVAICPPEYIIKEVHLLKQKLAQQIGWFNSINSNAHITFNTLLANEEELFVWKNYLAKFCEALHPFEIRLIKSGFYANGAFYLSPDGTSKETLIDIMKRFHKKRPLQVEGKSFDPHLSIARGLTKVKLDIANEILGNQTYNLKFTCGDLSIRKFDYTKKQYFIDGRFDFCKDPKISHSRQIDIF